MPLIRSLLSSALLALVTAPLMAQAPTDFLAEFDGQFNASARKFVALAEAMPAEAYDWSPMEGTLTVQQDSYAESQGQVVQNLIELYRALGGGWQPDPDELAQELEDQENGEPIF